MEIFKTAIEKTMQQLNTYIPLGTLKQLFNAQLFYNN